MKPIIIDRVEQNPERSCESRAAGPRIHPSKPSEHRQERRKIREQLRRLNWFYGGEDELFA